MLRRRSRAPCDRAAQARCFPLEEQERLSGRRERNHERDSDVVSCRVSAVISSRSTRIPHRLGSNEDACLDIWRLLCSIVHFSRGDSRIAPL